MNGLRETCRSVGESVESSLSYSSLDVSLGDVIPRHDTHYATQPTNFHQQFSAVSTTSPRGSCFDARAGKQRIGRIFFWIGPKSTDWRIQESAGGKKTSFTANKFSSTIFSSTVFFTYEYFRKENFSKRRGKIERLLPGILAFSRYCSSLLHFNFYFAKKISWGRILKNQKMKKAPPIA